MKRVVQPRCALLGVLVVLLHVAVLSAQVRQEIRLPDILGYKTLKCDFHMHTVFSDGLVWPTVRVDEAWREGLDVISITDHIEYQPHKDDVPTKHNRPYEIALPRAKERGILLVRGAEITRETPPGHFNAIFLEDVTPLDTKELLDCMAAAGKQGAFIWWNHPGWKPDKKGWFDIHTQLYEKKHLHGIEVVNGLTYYPEAHQWALDKNLTFMGNSDLHDPCPVDETTPERHRPMTLVFAKAKTVEAVKEALLSGRTVVWYNDQLIGKREYLQAIYEKAVAVCDIDYEGEDTVRFALENDCDISLKLQRSGKVGPKELVVPAGGKALFKLKVKTVESPTELSYIVQNFLVAPGKGLPVSFTVPGQVTVNIDVDVARQ
ncbi:MAG: hypothetical protein JW955_25600 [Sedimentisphaerales bacterium]|nr:hypothetical protein [Sedimentisphaerales bacterium]